MAGDSERTHRSFAGTVRRLAAMNWGRPGATHEEAVKQLDSRGWGVAEAALLELVRRVNQVAEALGRDRGDDERHEERPEWAVPLAGARVGDVLFYWCEDEHRVRRSLVARIDDDGFARLVGDSDWVDGRGRVHLGWADGRGAGEPAAAVLAAREEVETDLAYHRGKVARIEAALRAAEAGDNAALLAAGKEG